MTIKLYNSKTRQKQDFTPLERSNVRMYVCGPTVYDRAHLGNARPAIVFDVLYRLLRHTYGDTHVTYVRNFTDVDDKINAKAAATGRSIGDICDETIGWYLDDMAAVGVMQPNHMPRATAFIPQMIEMISGLIDKGHAYAANGHVLFRVRSYKNYGALSGRTVDDMIAGARVEVAPFKEDPMDFVLWKPSSEFEPGWDSPWGRGRPGWHIECSAMAYELLGDTFDIHGGGLDLQFPHHENELAQSACAHPQGGFAQVWMHNEMLQVEGKKMSKSLGNFFTVRDLLDGNHQLRKGKITGLQIRMAFLTSHYRDPMDFSESRLIQIDAMLYDFFGIFTLMGFWGVSKLHYDRNSLSRPFLNALCDDLNTPLAISLLHKDAKELRSSDKNDWLDKANSIYSGLRLMGFDLKRSALIKNYADLHSPNNLPSEVSYERTYPRPSMKLAIYRGFISEVRNQCKLSGNFEVLDTLKSKLRNYGLEVRFKRDEVEIVRRFESDLRVLPYPEQLMARDF